VQVIVSTERDATFTLDEILGNRPLGDIGTASSSAGRSGACLRQDVYQPTSRKERAPWPIPAARLGPVTRR
jgi:hypothetical protein